MQKTGSNMSIALAVFCAAHIHEQGLRAFPKDYIIIPASSLSPTVVQWPCWAFTSNWHSPTRSRPISPLQKERRGKEMQKRSDNKIWRKKDGDLCRGGRNVHSNTLEVQRNQAGFLSTFDSTAVLAKSCDGFHQCKHDLLII